MVRTHSLGFPRIGANRELKFVLERYWKGNLSRDEFFAAAQAVHEANIDTQIDAGLDFVPAGDFSLYDHVLDTSELLGDLPRRAYETRARAEHPLDTYFRVARGRSASGAPIRAGEMTKWFDTNYHYIVPEIDGTDVPTLHPQALLAKLDAVAERASISRAKPVILGPVTYLVLGKTRNAAGTDTSSEASAQLLERYLPLYRELLGLLHARGFEWVQIDEPALALDLDAPWAESFERAYSELAGVGPKILLATYFGPILHNVEVAARLAVDGFHLDAVRGGREIDATIAGLPDTAVVSLGIVDGRNIWRSDLSGILDRIEPIHARLADRLWLAPSSSLLHVPYDSERENELDPEIASWLGFAEQKLDELAVLSRALNEGRDAVASELHESDSIAAARRDSTLRTDAEVQARVVAVSEDMARRRLSYAQRAVLQRERLNLPLFPTTTIGSFPQTSAIRRLRRAWRSGAIGDAVYRDAMRKEIARVIREQEAIGLDVLVHGEPERNDMVEYFGEQLSGFAFTASGWVQSYGSRCVKPPIIYGDVARPRPMTLEWTGYAASLTRLPVKGMLTGPITILEWSFVRDDQSREETAVQIALALRDEVHDLEAAGTAIIQVDEPAIREGLPLRRAEWGDYLRSATHAFRLCTACAAPATQIHTHMCYAEFNDIIESVAAMDADVITMETSRSDMELFDSFGGFDYPNEIGPGVYDIHSPNIPETETIVELIRRAETSIPSERLWVNPDCGLKTRRWSEVRPALRNMVAAASELRAH